MWCSVGRRGRNQQVLQCRDVKHWSWGGTALGWAACACELCEGQSLSSECLQATLSVFYRKKCTFLSLACILHAEWVALCWESPEPTRPHCGKVLGQFRGDARNFESCACSTLRWKVTVLRYVNWQSKVGFCFSFYVQGYGFFKYAPGLICLFGHQIKMECLKMPMLCCLFFFFTFACHFYWHALCFVLSTQSSSTASTCPHSAFSVPQPWVTSSGHFPHHQTELASPSWPYSVAFLSPKPCADTGSSWWWVWGTQWVP